MWRAAECRVCVATRCCTSPRHSTCHNCTWDVSKVSDKVWPRAKIPKSLTFHPRGLWLRSAWKCKPCHSVCSSLSLGKHFQSTSWYVRCLQGGSATSTSGAGWEQQSADKSGNSEQGNIKDFCPQECTPPEEGNYHPGSSAGSRAVFQPLHCTWLSGILPSAGILLCYTAVPAHGERHLRRWQESQTAPPAATSEGRRQTAPTCASIIWQSLPARILHLLNIKPVL